jgi:NADH-quinone oxidoreductase subunit L
VNKWYFDELIDLVIVRPVRWFGRFAHDTFERLVVGGAIVGGSTGAVRGASAVVRRLQGGYLRTYSAVVLVGLAVLLVYFLIQS